MSEGRGSPEKYTPAQMIEALTKSGGINLGAAMVLGCSPTTVKRYIKEYPEVADAIPDIVSNTLDLAETKLIELIGKGNLGAVIFYLKTKGRERGYVERRELSDPDGKPLGAGAQVTIFQFPENGRDPKPAPDGAGG